MIGPRSPHRITVFHPAGSDEWGVPTGTTTANVKARVEYSTRYIRNAAGEQVVSRAQVVTEHAVTVGDTITLPDGTQQQAMDVRPVSGLGGTEDHREIYL